MAVLFISPTDTRGVYATVDTVETILQTPRAIERVKGTELETLWQVETTSPHLLGPMRIVTNRYEESHQIMQEAYQRQEHREQRAGLCDECQQRPANANTGACGPCFYGYDASKES